MSTLRRKRNLIAVIVGVSVFLAAFGIALAATVQVSRQVPSQLAVVEVGVLADENLFLSRDPEGNEPVTGLEFVLRKLQPPLRQDEARRRVFIRNDSEIDLRLIEPCREVFAFDDEFGLRLGFLNASIHDLATEEFLGNSCDRNVMIAPGQTVMAFVHIGDIDPDIPEDNFPFTAVFGAIGEDSGE